MAAIRSNLSSRPEWVLTTLECVCVCPLIDFSDGCASVDGRGWSRCLLPHLSAARWAHVKDRVDHVDHVDGRPM